jgi:ribonuclease HI
MSRRVLVVSLEAIFAVEDDLAVEQVVAWLRGARHAVVGKHSWGLFTRIAPVALSGADMCVLVAHGWTGHCQCESGAGPAVPFVSSRDACGSQLQWWVRAGGSLVVLANEDRANSLSALFGKTWKLAGYSRVSAVLNRSAEHLPLFARRGVPAEVIYCEPVSLSEGLDPDMPDIVPVVRGWHYHGQPNYCYIGKGDDGVPEFMDYGALGESESEAEDDFRVDDKHGHATEVLAACGSYGAGRLVFLGGVHFEEDTEACVLALAAAARSSLGQGAAVSAAAAPAPQQSRPQAEPQPQPQPRAMVCMVVQFDGSARPNPGRGGFCAVVGLQGLGPVSAPPLDSAEFAGALGDKLCTSNIAEYCGLIAGLRGAVQRFGPERCSACRLTVVGDSELVIKQMRGEYKVRDARLRHYHVVAQGLVARFFAAGAVAFQHVPREVNLVCDTTAKRWSAGQLKVQPESCAVFYPNRMHMVPVRINGLSMLASNEVGTTYMTQLDMIDAALLVELLGEAALRELSDPYPITRMAGAVPLNTLGLYYPRAGTPPLEISIDVRLRAGRVVVGERVVLSARDKPLLVVDNLPVPIHLSSRHYDVLGELGLANTGLRDRYPFSAELAGPRYATHPFWHASDSNVIFFPHSV